MLTSKGRPVMYRRRTFVLKYDNRNKVLTWQGHGCLDATYLSLVHTGTTHGSLRSMGRQVRKKKATSFQRLLVEVSLQERTNGGPA